MKFIVDNFKLPGCSLAFSSSNLIDYTCDDLPTTIRIAPCLEAGDILFVKVASSESNCGTFNISIDETTPTCDSTAGLTYEEAEANGQ
ncbi:MAG: hypothetical protein R2771_15815 [Saprospiraceae bacterium]